MRSAVSRGTSAVVRIVLQALHQAGFSRGGLKLSRCFLGELLPRQRTAWETTQRCSFEIDNKWVMEAGFHGLIRGGSQRISAK